LLRETIDGLDGTETRLTALSNLKDKLKLPMQAAHRLGRARTNTGYYNYWSNIWNEVNRKATNAFWTTCKLQEQRNVMKYRTGNLFNQKHAHRYNPNESIFCPLCSHVDSALHMLSGCQHTMLKNMITERHNIATRMIIQALSRGSFGANLCFTDVGSDARLMSQVIDPTGMNNRTLPPWLLPQLSDEDRLTRLTRLHYAIQSDRLTARH